MHINPKGTMLLLSGVCLSIRRGRLCALALEIGEDELYQPLEPQVAAPLKHGPDGSQKEDNDDGPFHPSDHDKTQKQAQHTNRQKGEKDVELLMIERAGCLPPEIELFSCL